MPTAAPDHHDKSAAPWNGFRWLAPWRTAVSLQRRFRRWFSRRELIVRLLGLPPVHPPSDAPGLLLLQIDGLSRSRLDHALATGRLPFVSSLIHRDDHRVHTMYSGQPATTPAVLGELFYGIPRAVPAFSFRDHRSGEVVEMLESEIAEPIEKELAARNRGLLTGGAAYCDIYSGGAEETQFCPGRTRWKRLTEARVWTKAILFLLHLPTFARLCAEITRETILSTARLLTRKTPVGGWWGEIKFIPRHLVASVLLRESTAIAAESDCIRGVERIHVNFLGYDDVSHHAGPDSSISRRMLRDIDRTIQRLWHAAHASCRRNYQVWILADHGQEATVPYEKEFGRPLAEAVREVGQQFLQPSDASPASPQASPDNETIEPLTVAIGPVGFVYWPAPLNHDSRTAIARQLVDHARCPLVMTRLGGEVIAWTDYGQFRMPAQANQVLPADHPHLDVVADDFARLCDHPDAGEFVVCGWRNEQPPMSFVDEIGAHGGPGPNETSGFVILPPDAPRLPEAKLRPTVLRDMALQWLEPSPARRKSSPSHPRPLRVVTYNVHGCVGTDGRLSPARIARVLAGMDADVIALQELDVGRSRSGTIDQAKTIAELLEMQSHFAAAIDVAGERYGNAILSRWPMTLRRASVLPKTVSWEEPRGALWATVEFDGAELEIVSTHLGLSLTERQRQLEAILDDDWPCLGQRAHRTIFCGDLNSPPASSICRTLARQLRDVQLADGRRGRATWPSSVPLRRLDHIFVGTDFDVIAASVPRTRLTRVASDHLPLVADLELNRIPHGSMAKTRPEDHAHPKSEANGRAVAVDVHMGEHGNGIRGSGERSRH
jgi:endonuclease/exonuclease/phosphatase family metal-dependent hydrolase